MSEFNTPDETTEVGSELGALGGSEHFSVGDLPPGVDSAEPVSATTEPDNSGGEVAPVEGQPPQRFWSFKTADGSEKIFQSQDEAQQFFGSWGGRLTKTQQELANVTQLNLDWQNAYNRGELAQLGVQPSDAKLKGEAEKAADAMESHDWDAVNRYIKNGEGDKALRYMQYKNGKYLEGQVASIRQDVEQRFDSLSAPDKFRQEVASAMEYVVDSSHKAVNDMGEPLFPEFQDGPGYDRDLVMRFKEIWLNQDYRMAANPDGSGFKAAYYEAKNGYVKAVPPAPKTAADFINGPQYGAAVARSIAAAPLVPRNPDGTFQKRNQALAMSSTGVPQAIRPTATTQVRKGILDEMRDIGTPRSPHFAVSPD